MKKLSSLTLIREFIKESSNNEKMLKKANYKANMLRGLDVVEAGFEAPYGPVYNEDVLNLIKSLKRSKQGFKRAFIRWFADSMQQAMTQYHMPIEYIKDNLTDEQVELMADWFDNDPTALDSIKNGLDFNSAVHAAVAWNDKKIEANEEKVKKAGSVQKVFDDPESDYTIVKLIQPDDATQEALLMQNCVGKYKEKIKNKQVMLFSLRDKFNNPHVSILVFPDGEVSEIKGKQNEVPIKKYADCVKRWLGTTDFDYELCADYNKM